MEFEDSNKLKGYLRSEADRLAVHSNKIYNMYFVRTILDEIYKNNNHDFVIIGSISQFANTNNLTRPLTDIDVASNLQLIDSSHLFERIIEDNNGPIKYKLLEKFITTKDTAVYKILCNFDKITHMVHLDLKHSKNDCVFKAILPPILKKDAHISINTINLEQLIANKLYAVMVSIFFNTIINKEIRRFKDFYDLYSMISNLPFDIKLVAKYFEENLAKYGYYNFNLIDWYLVETQFLEYNQKMYNEYSKNYNFLNEVSFGETINSSKNIYDSVVSENNKSK